MGREWPFSTPIVGLPLMFAAAALVSYLVSPVRLQVFRIARETVDQLLPLLATLTCAGILVEVMTLTGARGLLAVAAVTLPIWVVYASLFLVLPASEAVLMWGAAPVIGVPLVLLFNNRGLDPIVALAGMSIIWPLGDALPPTAIIGRLTVDVVGHKGTYRPVPPRLPRAGAVHHRRGDADGGLLEEARLPDRNLADIPVMAASRAM